MRKQHCFYNKKWINKNYSIVCQYVKHVSKPLPIKFDNNVYFFLCNKCCPAQYHQNISCCLNTDYCLLAKRIEPKIHSFHGKRYLRMQKISSSSWQFFTVQVFNLAIEMINEVLVWLQSWQWTWKPCWPLELQWWRGVIKSLTWLYPVFCVPWC